MENEFKKQFERLGKNIVKMRKRKGYSQYRLAKETLSDQSYLAKLEEGETNPTLKTLLKISQTLDCDIKDLFE